MNTLKTINKIKEIAKQNQERDKSQKTHEINDANLPIGTCYRQGDLYIHRVADNHPVGKELKRDKIADGVSLGSTHILMGDFRVYEGTNAPNYLNRLHKEHAIGYAFDVGKNAVNVHMEHDHFCFTQTGRYQVTHQMNMQTLQRVSD